MSAELLSRPGPKRSASSSASLASKFCTLACCARTRSAQTASADRSLAKRPRHSASSSSSPRGNDSLPLSRCRRAPSKPLKRISAPPSSRCRWRSLDRCRSLSSSRKRSSRMRSWAHARASKECWYSGNNRASRSSQSASQARISTSLAIRALSRVLRPWRIGATCVSISVSRASSPLSSASSAAACLKAQLQLSHSRSKAAALVSRATDLSRSRCKSASAAFWASSRTSSLSANAASPRAASASSSASFASCVCNSASVACALLSRSTTSHNIRSASSRWTSASLQRASKSYSLSNSASALACTAMALRSSSSSRTAKHSARSMMDLLCDMRRKRSASNWSPAPHMQPSPDKGGPDASAAASVATPMGADTPGSGAAAAMDADDVDDSAADTAERVDTAVRTPRDGLFPRRWAAITRSSYGWQTSTNTRNLWQQDSMRPSGTLKRS
mmetsp:Transcript_51478/g.130016  ORF Transcript_51478/g.130016 Transcript_51478/m.130016 type:complete len:447 (-) Transcript_51478:12-1352(-)